MELTVISIESQNIWEDFLNRHSPASLFQSWSWGSVQDKLGVRVWRIGLYERGILIGIAQIVKVIAKRGTFLHIRHGPIVSKQDTQYWDAIFSYCKQLAQKEHAWFVRVSPLIEDTQKNAELFSSLGLRPSPMHAMDAELCWVLDLDLSENELLAGMRKSTRYDIKKAEKMGVEVTFSDKSNDLDKFMVLYKRTSRRHEFVPHKGIYEEFDEFNKYGQVLLLSGSYQGELLASALILFYGNQAIYHHGASVISSVPVSALVQWKAILEAKKRGISVYNFWGIAPDESPNHPWRGITLFKKGFGGRQIKYLHAHDLVVHPMYVLPFVVEKFRSMKKGY